MSPFQRVDVVPGPRDVVAAAEIEPFERAEITAEIAFQHLEGFDQRVGVLLAERVHMEALHARRQRVGEVCARDAETRIGRAGVVNRAGLRGVLRIDAQARAHARERG